MFQDITRVSQMAKEAAKNNERVINATVGVLLDDNGQIVYSEVFDELLANLTPQEKYPYADVAGPVNIRDNILKFLHQEVFSDKEQFTMLTAGGTGGISNVISVFKKNAGLVVSDLCWNNYLTIAKIFGVDVYSYPMFKNEGFNTESLEEQIKKAVSEKENVVVLINTPSQNPTGYDLTNDELSKVVSIVNNAKKEGTKITVLLDIAYYNFGMNQNLDPFVKLDDDVNLAIVYSFSKSLGIYGLRLGTLTMISKDVKDLEKVFYSHSRTKWSTPNKLGCSVIEKILSNEDNMNKVYAEIDEHLNMLKSKTSMFKQELDNYGIKTHPYVNGFFMTIPVEDPEQTALELSKNDVYVTTSGDGVRVAMSGVPSFKLKELAKRINEVINK